MDQDRQPTLVVGVGASAGGLEAFKQLLSALPDDTGMALLLVQHLDPTHKSLLAELLAPHTGMTVRDADQDLRVAANTVYIIRPDTALAVRDGRIELSEPTLHRGVRLPVDHLFRSLARDYGARSVGIVLSGAGSDGSAGIRAIKSAGGLTVAQSPEHSGQPGMPQAAIDTGLVDLVLDVAEMPAALDRFARLPPQACIEPSAPSQEETVGEQPTSLDPDDLGRLAALLDAQLNFDLRVYKPTTVERRVLRRMALSGHDEAPSYFEHLRRDAAEQQQLVRDLLISVTEFFREPESFLALREMVITPAVAGAKPGDTLRAWVPGCATGEEAYSIAIEFLDAIDERADRRVDLQVIATDIDQDALSFARTAVYPPSIVDRVSAKRLESYFKPLDGRGFQVRPQLRDVVSFAVHDLTKDPPFSRMSLVSCRNVLIYLTSQAQRHVLKVLHFALEPDGHLFLSTSESTGPQRELFHTVSKKHRIFEKLGRSRPLSIARSRGEPTTAPRDQAGAVRPRRVNASDLARRALMDACMPPSVVIAEDGTVLYTHGEVERYLRFPRDDGPRFDLSSLLRPEIATRTRGVLHKCRRDDERVVAVAAPDGATGPRVRITATPAAGLGDGAVILNFEDSTPTTEGEPATAADSSDREEDAVVEQLERELQATREDLRNTVEELESSNEELRSSNEESMSMNEELQSANEELEATTEELRSLNEELTTVNGQLRDKVEQLEQANDDLQNFFASTQMATIFLDERLRIKRFTPAASELLGIDQADVGRSITHIARELLQRGLPQEAQEVLDHLVPQTREIHTEQGRWLSRQILPYRTEARRIEGVVITFVDITELKTATERLAAREEQHATIARLGLHALQEFDVQEFMQEVVGDTQRTLGTEYCMIMEVQPGAKKLLLRSGVGWKASSLGTAIEAASSASPAGYALRSREPLVIGDVEGDRRFAVPDLLQAHGVKSGVACAIGDAGHRYGVIGAFTDRPRAFTRKDANFLQATANIVGSAISRYQARVRLALEVGVAQVLAEASELDETLGLLLERMAKELGTSVVGELWWPAGGQTLQRRSLYVAPSHEASWVERHFSRDLVERGEGLVGRVYDQGRAEWATDLGDPQLFSRAEAADALGLLSGIALPIESDGQALGVIVLFSSERIFADEGYLSSLEAVGRSIGAFIARWEADRAARELAAITESSHDAILSYRADGTVTRWLAGAEALFGFSAEEMVGSSIERLVPEDRREELRTINERILRGEVVEPYETTRRRKDGGVVEVSVRSSAIVDSDGRIVGISSTDRDITRRKETERKLLAADQQKDEFLAMLGHELRNPLAAIRSATDLLQLAGSEDRRIERARSVLDRQSSHVAKLLDSLLDVSRIIRGKIKLDREVFDLGALCREHVADVLERLVGEQRDVELEVPPEPVWVEADRVRVVQMLDNLLSNAIKYTGEGDAIRVSLSRDDGTAVLEVRDSGVGIEPELLPQLFQVFRQSKQSIDRSRGGLGLGLALVRFLAELHGGSVEAMSEGQDRGAEFVVRLPLTDQRPSPVVGPPDGGKARRILLIEDNEDAAEMLAAVLEHAGYEVAVATTGERGIALARERPPDVVLCDLGLPDQLSGFDVARELRACPETQQSRLFAVTGYGRPEDRRRSGQAGFERHLTKPVTVEAFEQALAASDDGPDDGR